MASLSDQEKLKAVHLGPSECDTGSNHRFGADTHRCITCGHPTTLKWTGSFHLQPNEENHYCSSFCVRKQWMNRRGTWRRYLDRLVIQRAATFTQRIFYMIRKLLFENNIGRIENDERGGLVFHHGVYPAGKQAYFCRFPSNDIVTNERDEKDLLSYRACDASLMIGRDILGSLIGRDYDIHEMLVRFRNIPRPTLLYPGLMTNLPDPHWLFKITTQDRDAYALDFAGNQFGYQDGPVITMRTYIKTRDIRSDAIYENLPTSQGSDMWGFERDGYLISQESRILADSERQATAVVHNIISQWAYEGVPFCKLMWGPQKTYQSGEELLLNEIQRGLGVFWDRIHDPVHGVFYRKGRFSFRKEGLDLDDCSRILAGLQMQ